MQNPFAFKRNWKFLAVAFNTGHSFEWSHAVAVRSSKNHVEQNDNWLPSVKWKVVTTCVRKVLISPLLIKCVCACRRTVRTTSVFWYEQRRASCSSVEPTPSSLFAETTLYR